MKFEILKKYKNNKDFEINFEILNYNLRGCEMSQGPPG